MTTFLIDMPSPNGKASGSIARVEGESWIVALGVGLRRLGQSDDFLRNVEAEIQKDGTVKVVEPRTGRVFRIARVDQPGEPGAPRTPKRVQERRNTIEPHVALPRASPLVAWKPYRGSVTKPDLPAVSPTVSEVPREPDLPAALPREVRRICWDGLNEKMLDQLLHLALRHVAAESGSAYVVESPGRTLRLCSAWGPKARQLLSLGLTLERGSGIAGLCVERGVLLSVSDPERDPHFNPRVSRKLGYPVQSMLAAPILRGQRGVACIQLLNRKGGGPFTSAQSGALSLLASTAGEALQSARS